ncbi:MAG: hypothetical protein DHS20C18_43990 [Saprospiraceae bacterium]|nr:MAG: hypothetical protein DHS20C18_43990 [Saprospiraceae bacterium]
MKNLNLSKITLWLLILVAFHSCGSLKYYDEAQKNFSLAAEMEMKKKGRDALSTDLVTLEELYPGAKPAIVKDSSVIKLYEEASISLGKALSTPSKLKNANFNLMGNAICLQSLTAWKLGNPQESLDKSKAALRELENTKKAAPTDERDLTMMTALPGIIDLEMAYDSMEQLKIELTQRLKTVQEASPTEKQAIFDYAQAHYQQFIASGDAESGVLLKAILKLEEAKTKAGSAHPIQSYLLQSQLTGMNTWAIELSEIDNAARVLGLRVAGSATKTWLEDQRKAYKSIRDAHLLTLEKMRPNGKADPAYKFWKKRL